MLDVKREYDFNGNDVKLIPIASNAVRMKCKFLKSVDVPKYGKLYYCEAGKALWIAKIESLPPETSAASFICIPSVLLSFIHPGSNLWIIM